MKSIISVIFSAGIAFTGTGIVSTASAKTFDGVIKGAECHLYGKFCGENSSDLKPKFERDFVLVSGNDYYLLDDLPYQEKLSLNNKTVKITGDQKGRNILVTQVKSKDSDGTYKEAWNWEKISFELYEN